VGKVTVHPAARAGKITPPARLAAGHDTSRFNCGSPLLDDWLRNHAIDSEGRTARTYVVCEGNVVVGYYCIATGSVERAALPSKLKRVQGLPKQIPVANIGRLGRDIKFRGTGLGSDLLEDALKRIVAASQTIGIRAVLVHALDEKSSAFYRNHDFIEYPLGTRTFFLSIETIAAAI
jgi:ribosomal protein S18 acetylase RimI-like enzyme